MATGEGRESMAVASVSTISSASPISWQDAVERGLGRARKTLRNITGITVIEEKARVEEGEITEFIVTLQVIFILEGTED
jgi:flavin-binding protein dodecin